MSAIKKYNDNTPHLKYYVYDILDENRSFKDRYESLKWLFSVNKYSNVELVQTHICKSEGDIWKWHKFFTDEGYEGSIIRDLNAKYKVNRRVDELLKLKDFTDAEFEIVDIIPAGGGSSADVGKFVCKTDSGDLFESTATGTEEERREYLKNKHDYIGKFAKVKYREMSGLNNVPFHSNVLEILSREELY
jgi:ATP-dependent DNA ligase